MNAWKRATCRNGSRRALIRTLTVNGQHGRDDENSNEEEHLRNRVIESADRPEFLYSKSSKD